MNEEEYIRYVQQHEASERLKERDEFELFERQNTVKQPHYEEEYTDFTQDE